MSQEFTSLCSQLETASKEEGRKLLENALQNLSLREQIRIAIDPNEASGPKPLGLKGIGPVAVNNIVPGLIKPFQMMTADQIHFGQGESWKTMIHHLEDPRNWVVSADVVGIHCLAEVKNRQVRFKLPSGIQVTNTALIEQSILNMFSIENMFELDAVTLDGRLFAVNTDKMPEIYEAFLQPTEEMDRLGFCVFDFVDTTRPFEERYAEMLCVIRRVIHSSYCYSKFMVCEPIDYSSTKQLDQYRQAGYSKVLLRYKKSLYEFGTSRNMLSLKL